MMEEAEEMAGANDLKIFLTGMIQEHPLIVNAKNVMASQQRGRLSKAMTDAESPSLRPETPISISPGRQISPVYEPGLGSPGVPPPIE